MDNLSFSDKFEISELVNKLFMYTDARQWDKLLNEVFIKEIWFDASSVGGGEPRLLEAIAICKMWEQGFESLDAIHHQAGHYLIDGTGDEAEIFAYAVATHYKKLSKKGNSRTFVGSYDLKAIRTNKEWRLTQFKYNLKFMDGNLTME